MMMKISPFFLTAAFACTALQGEDTVLWIGTGGANAAGIYRCIFNTETGELSEPVLAAELESPGFVALTADRTRLYSLSREEKGSVVAFSIGEDHSLTLINKQVIGDGAATHLSLDKTERILFTAQYGSGSVAAFPIHEDGSIGERSALVKHSGKGKDPGRQEAPHPHWTGVTPDNRFLLIPDLGIDQIKIYEIDHASATIREHGFGAANPGSGPRHLKFSPDGKRIYVGNELDMTLSVFDYDAEAGTMTPVETLETLPKEDQEILNKVSEVRVHPSGRFVYVANRGHDSITVFSVDEKTGALSFVEREAIRGAYPRNFNLDPTGQWLLAAGRISNTIAIFKIDQETGNLIFSTRVVNAPSPICLEF